MTGRARSDRDYYEVLGVHPEATEDELRRAYRQLALRWHPDRNPGSADAAERFKEISEAYAVLTNRGRRRQYDIVGDTVNLASRLCSQAGKGEIVLPEAMIERFTNVPEMESMGAVQLKGLEQPVPLFKVLVGESEPRVPAPAPSPAPA